METKAKAIYTLESGALKGVRPDRKGDYLRQLRKTAWYKRKIWAIHIRFFIAEVCLACRRPWGWPRR